MGTAAAGAVAVTAFVFGFHKLDDFDTWWHLASGRWIAVHGAIPATDTLSHTVPGHAWINMQWGFDLLLYALHQAGGPALLSVSGAAVFLATTVLLLRLTTQRVGHSLGALVVLIAVVAAQERVTLRPELLSFLLLAAVLSVLDHGKRHDGRWLWLLVPLMLLWVNVHALFVLGVFAIVCALVGTATTPHRQLVLWGGAALLSILVNPFGLRGVWFPLTLFSRIDGSQAVFQTIGEFSSPPASDAAGVSILFYKLLLAIGGAVGVAAVVTHLRRRRTGAGAGPVAFDWGGAVFFLGLAAVSTSARRNVAIFAIGSLPFVASRLQTLLPASPKLAYHWTRRAPIAAAIVTMVAVLVSATVVTGEFYKRAGSAQEFGVGVIEGTFPERAAAFARAAALPGRLYNDMASGGYLA